MNREVCRRGIEHNRYKIANTIERPLDMFPGGVRYRQTMKSSSYSCNCAYQPVMRQQPARLCSIVCCSVAPRSKPTGQQPSSWGSQHYREPNRITRVISRSSQKEQDPAYKYSDGVNQFLGNFLPSSSFAREELSVDLNAPKLKNVELTQLADLVEQGLAQTQWFVTGEVDARLFSDSFAFKDESVATTGIKAYAVGVRKLFDQATSKVELISVAADTAANTIIVIWRLEGRVNLPFKPKIKPYVVTTTFGIDADGLICSQVDEFSVPGWDLLLSTFLGEQFGAAPAPPAETLRAAVAAGQKVN